MITYLARDHGILPGKHIAKELSALLHLIANDDNEKEIVFEHADYYLDSCDCDTEKLVITNTVGDEQFEKNETPHINQVALNLKNVKNLKFSGNGACFIINGKVTNAALQNCENVTLVDLELKTVNPDLHELRVVGKTAFSVDFELDKESQYLFTGGAAHLIGEGYDVSVAQGAASAHWIGLIQHKTPNTVKRVSHPLLGNIKMKEIRPYVFRAYYLNTFRFHKDDRFYLFDVRRQYAGIFVSACKNITLRGIKQRFNYSLAFVAQDTENIVIDNVEFAPEKNAAKKLASVADFIQICMCKGDVRITNSLFEGAGDDCLNVHGIHFKITKVHGNQITVRFMHPQSHGFNPIHSGDQIAFISPATLLETGTTTVVSSALLNEYEIALELDSAAHANTGDVIEDVSSCPNLYFAGNRVNRIITRALLITTRGKVLVKENHFISNSMSAVLLSDDAKRWYESGMCRDVTIQDNVFEYCGKTPILIKPENSVYKGPVHKNIRIIGNRFLQYKGVCISAKASQGIQISGNSFASDKKLKSVNCTDLKTDF